MARREGEEDVLDVVDLWRQHGVGTALECQR
jgi:hypothetical protein